MIRLGPFRFVYTQREQKLRDTLQHLINRWGLTKARMVIADEIRKLSLEQEEQLAWWTDLYWMAKQAQHALAYGYEKGIR